MFEILIVGIPYQESNIDVLLEASEMINGEIKARASQELALLDQRKQQLEAIMGPAAVSLSAEPKMPAGTKTKATRIREAVNPPKYYNPANPTQVWTGRGKPPAWFNKDAPAFVNPDDYLTAATHSTDDGAEPDAATQSNDSLIFAMAASGHGGGNGANYPLL